MAFSISGERIIFFGNSFKSISFRDPKKSKGIILARAL